MIIAESGQHRTLEECCRLFPQLGGLGNVTVDVIHAEYEARLQCNQTPDLSDYQRRFPNLYERLLLLIAEASKSESAVASVETSRAAIETHAVQPDAYGSLPKRFGRYEIMSLSFSTTISTSPKTLMCGPD